MWGYPNMEIFKISFSALNLSIVHVTEIKKGEFKK